MDVNLAVVSVITFFLFQIFCPYAKKSSLVSGNQHGEIFFITYPPA